MAKFSILHFMICISTKKLTRCLIYNHTLPIILVKRWFTSHIHVVRKINRRSIVPPDREDTRNVVQLFHSLFTMFLLRRTSWSGGERYGARGTRPQPTQLAFQSSPLEPASHATLKYQRRSKRRADRIPSVSATTRSSFIFLETLLSSAFHHPAHPPYIYGRSACNPDIRGTRGRRGRGRRRKGIAKSRHRFPVEMPQSGWNYSIQRRSCALWFWKSGDEVRHSSRNVLSKTN